MIVSHDNPNKQEIKMITKIAINVQQFLNNVPKSVEFHSHEPVNPIAIELRTALTKS